MAPALGELQASPDFPTPSATPPLPNVVASAATVAALYAAGTPLQAKTLLVDPATGMIYGQSDGAGGYVSIDDSGGPEYAMPASDMLPAVGTTTVPAPADPAAEYITTAGSAGSSTASSTWGGHQNRMVRMADGTCFAVVTEIGLAALKRSVTGGGYGAGAWTTVVTVNTADRAAADLDTHLVRHPVLDLVHFVATDSSRRVRIRTYNSAGALVNDVMVPDIYPGWDPAIYWVRETSGTLYSSVSIGADGTIAMLRTVTSTPPAYVANMVAGVMVQTLRFDGGSWTYSGARLLDVGPRIAYFRAWVSPPGHEGFIVGLAQFDVQWKEWTLAKNPYYNSSWTNTFGCTSYLGGGRSPAINLFKIPLRTLDSISVVSALGPNFRTTDISSTNPPVAEFMGYTPSAFLLDRQGRFWLTYNGNEDGVANKRGLVVIRPDGTQQYKYIEPGVATIGQITWMHEDLSGKIWCGWESDGPVVQCRVIGVTESGGALTFENVSYAFELSATAWGSNLVTGRYESAAGVPPRTHDGRNGSARTHNWVQIFHVTCTDHTGPLPGNVPGTVSDGAVKAKRIHVQLPI